MDTKVLFDSKSYIRKIPVHFSLFDGSKDIIKKDTLELNRMVIIETERYKRLFLQTSESDVSDAIFDLQDELLNCFKKSDYSAYISISGKPNGEENSVVCFLDDTLTCFSETSTKSKERVFTSYINDETFFVINGEKKIDGKYSDYISDTYSPSDEEKEFIHNICKSQTFDDQSVSAKEKKELEKKLEKERKEVEKKEKGGFFSFKKKQEKEVAIVSETGEYINPKSLKVHKGSVNPDYELQNIVGLDSVKKDIEKMKSMLEYEASRKQRGIESHDTATLHMCFMGHPGTGKTTVARIMTGIMFSMGYIKENRCIEISGLDLQGGYVGQTAIITKQIVNLAKGGILFIDEAYALCENKENSFGSEAVSVLLKEMEDNRGDIIVILAGYEDDMNKFLDINQGFRSRINKYFEFADYTSIELGKIFINYIKKMHLKIEETAFTKCMILFNKARKLPNFSNGRFVRNLAEKIEEQHILNCTNLLDTNRMDTITIEDVPDTLIEYMITNA